MAVDVTRVLSAAMMEHIGVDRYYGLIASLAVPAASLQLYTRADIGSSYLSLLILLILLDICLLQALFDHGLVLLLLLLDWCLLLLLLLDHCLMLLLLLDHHLLIVLMSKVQAPHTYS